MVNVKFLILFLGGYMKQLTKEQLDAFEKFNDGDMSCIALVYSTILSESNAWINYSKNKNIQYVVEQYLRCNRVNSVLEKKKFIKTIEEYELIVKKTAYLAKTLGISDNIILYFFVYYLIFDNYFATNRKETAIDDLYISEYEGVNIMLGNWCCRHSADFMKRVLAQKDYDVKNISVATRKDSSSTDHATLLMHQNNKYYVFDSTKPYISQVRDDCAILSPHGLGEIRLGSLFMFDYNHADLQYVLKTYEKIGRNHSWQPYTPFSKEYEESMRIIKRKKRDLRNFKEDIVPNIGRIKEEKKILKN